MVLSFAILAKMVASNGVERHVQNLSTTLSLNLNLLTKLFESCKSILSDLTRIHKVHCEVNNPIPKSGVQTTEDFNLIVDQLTPVEAQKLIMSSKNRGQRRGQGAQTSSELDGENNFHQLDPYFLRPKTNKKGLFID